MLLYYMYYVKISFGKPKYILQDVKLGGQNQLRYNPMDQTRR